MMTKAFAVLLVLVASQAALEARAQSDTAERSIADFLVDLTPGPVSAAEFLGMSPSAVTTIQTPKDFVAVFASPNGGTKEGVGLSVTPARTTLSSLSVNSYQNGNLLMRALASTTLSYAQNKATVASADYKQDAFALHTSLYADVNNDPAVAVHKAFSQCTAVQDIMTAETNAIGTEVEKMRKAGDKRPVGEITAEVVRRLDRKTNAELAATKAIKECIASADPPPWNATQYAATLGSARIKTPLGNLSLQRSASLTAAIRAGTQGLVNVTARRSFRELDLNTIATTPAYKSSNLVAARYTYGSGEKATTFALAEISNAKASTATTANAAFKYAVGIDHRIMEGAWLEFRLGRSRSIDSGVEETKALLNLKLSTTTDLPRASGGGR